MGAQTNQCSKCLWQRSILKMLKALADQYSKYQWIDPISSQKFYCTPFIQRYSHLSHDVQSHSQICFIMILADRQSIAVQRQNGKHLIEKSPKVLFFHPRPHICLPSLLLCESTTQQSPRRPHTNCRHVCQLYTNDTGTFSFSHYP